MKTLITGATGFIGRNLKEGLTKNHKLFTPTSKDLNLLNTRQVSEYLENNKFDVVIHCATHNATVTSDKDLAKVLHSNLRMFFNLVRCNRLYGRMFYFGSGAEYDKRFPIAKAKEEDFDKRVPEDEYGFSKYIMTKYSECTDNIYNLKLFGCFGKYEDWRIRFISNAICRTIFDMNVTISKNAYFDYMYINDLVKIIKWFISAKKLKYKSYHICTGRKIDLFTLAEKIVKESGRKINIKIAEKGFKPEYSGDNSRLLKEMKKFDFIEIEDAIKDLYMWYEKNKSIINVAQIK